MSYEASARSKRTKQNRALSSAAERRILVDGGVSFVFECVDFVVYVSLCAGPVLAVCEIDGSMGFVRVMLMLVTVREEVHRRWRDIDVLRTVGTRGVKAVNALLSANYSHAINDIGTSTCSQLK